MIECFIPLGGLRKEGVFDKILTLEFNAEDMQVDKLLDEIESYWSTRTEGYSEVNEKELKGMQKKAWLETLESGFWGKRSGKNQDVEEVVRGSF